MDTFDSLTIQALSWAWGWFAVLMLVRVMVIVRRGYKVELGRPKGSPRRGILYSLTFSMLPWKKESTRRHAWSYAAGMGMHVGLFTLILFAMSRRWMVWPTWSVAAVGALAGLGWACAFGLFIKRGSKPYMHAISSPDDFISSLLVQFYLAAGCVAAFTAAATPAWRLAVVLLLLYIPLGKIFHMLLFFVSRILFGLQFGRRGVLRHDLPVSY